MADEDEITLDGEPVDLSEQDSEESEETLGEKPATTEDKVKRKEELEAELSTLDAEAVSDADEISEDIAQESPEKGQVASEAREAAQEIAGEYNLSKAQEDKLANAITQKVLESLSGVKPNKQEKQRPRDKRPKPSHFSERVIGKRKDRS